MPFLLNLSLINFSRFQPLFAAHSAKKTANLLTSFWLRKYQITPLKYPVRYNISLFAPGTEKTVVFWKDGVFNQIALPTLLVE